MSVAEFLSKDWQKIPQNFRFFILSGVLMIAIVLTNDQFGSEDLTYLGLSRNNFFNIGIGLVLAGIGLVLYKQIILANAIRKLRQKYPVSEINKSFYLVHFGDPIYLLDSRDKLVYHVYPLKTARDLSFNLYTYDAGMTFEEAKTKDFELGTNGDKVHFKVNDYEFAGQINTTY